jgi:Ca-activated chloride channel family protein
VSWDAGVPIDAIESVTHRVDVRRDGARRASVTLHPFDSIPNKDFVVRCRAKGNAPEAGVLAYHDGDSGYLSVLVHPKLDLSTTDVTPKEMIFVLDCSGSMSGEPIAAAKALVRHALTNVDPRDTFQIIRFSEDASGFAPRPVPATVEREARPAYLGRFKARAAR